MHAHVLSRNFHFCLDGYLSLNAILFLHKNLIFDIESIWELEQSTINQTDCAEWRKGRIRIYRLTSSSFYDIYNRAADMQSLAERIYNSHFKVLSHIPTIAHGVQYESLVRNFIRMENNSAVIRKVGLVTNPFYPYLSGSPDGLIHTTDNTQLIEIKCIFNPCGSNLEELSKRSNFASKILLVNGKWKLKTFINIIIKFKAN